MSASGLSWTLEHTAERKEDGGDGHTGGWKGLAAPLGKAGVVWCSSWALPPPPPGQGPVLWHSTGGVAPPAPTHPPRLSWAGGQEQSGVTPALEGSSGAGGAVAGGKGRQRSRSRGAGAPDTELFPTRLRWIAGLTWEIASLPR